MVGNAPKIFTLTSRRGLPYVSVATCAAFAFLAYMGINGGSGKVFNWFANSMCLSCLYTEKPTNNCVSDLRRGVDDMVWHWLYLHTLLRGDEGAGNGPYEAALLLKTATICGLVRDDLLLHHLLRESPYIHFPA